MLDYPSYLHINIWPDFEREKAAQELEKLRVFEGDNLKFETGLESTIKRFRNDNGFNNQGSYEGLDEDYLRFLFFKYIDFVDKFRNVKFEEALPEFEIWKEDMEKWIK